MLSIPFELLSVSWPRPAVVQDARWASEPDWDAPPSPFRPQPQWRTIEGEPAWTLDWCALFRSPFAFLMKSELRHFHVVFRIRAVETGRLVFWEDDGSIIRLGGRVVHEDRTAHSLRRNEVEVRAGDVLEVAQWQNDGDWLWCARTPTVPAADAEAVYAPFVDEVCDRLRGGDGPPLKIFTDGRFPLRTVVSAYSLVLNGGYAPSEVLLYGSHQWSPAATAMFRDALPFAEVIDTARVISGARALGGPVLGELTRNHWFVMKACMALLDGPDVFAVLDDDLFVLEPVDDALEAFRDNDLVYVPDAEHGRVYHQVWGAVFGQRSPSPAGNFNAGLYWCRRTDQPHRLASLMARVRPGGREAYLWEQGFIASAYAHRKLHALPHNRYLFPLFDGLPGGPLGYDYAGNPCELTCVHFGGIPDKPTDDQMRYIGPSILARRAARAARPELAMAG